MRDFSSFYLKMRELSSYRPASARKSPPLRNCCTWSVCFDLSRKAGKRALLYQTLAVMFQCSASAPSTVALKFWTPCSTSAAFAFVHSGRRSSVLPPTKATNGGYYWMDGSRKYWVVYNSSTVTLSRALAKWQGSCMHEGALQCRRHQRELTLTSANPSRHRWGRQSFEALAARARLLKCKHNQVVNRLPPISCKRRARCSTTTTLFFRDSDSQAWRNSSVRPSPRMKHWRKWSRTFISLSGLI